MSTAPRKHQQNFRESIVTGYVMKLMSLENNFKMKSP